MGTGSKEGSLKLNSQRALSFLLGAALPTILLFALATDRVGEQLSSVSGGLWGYKYNGGTQNNNGTRPAAPALQEDEVYNNHPWYS
jgi:hypothetical protein